MSERGEINPANEWDLAAKRQDLQQGDTGDIVRRLYYDPTISQLIGDVSAKDILDAGCGNGYWVRRLAKDARSVIGVDHSEELLRLASAYPTSDNASYANMDITKLACPDESFDLVLSNVVVDYVPDLNGFAAESHRVLRANGSLVIGIIHPFFHTMMMHDGNRMYANTLGYLDEGTVKRKTYNGALEVTIFNRKVSDYINPFIANELSLSGIVEPPIPQSLLDADPKYECDKSVPRFLMLRFDK